MNANDWENADRHWVNADRHAMCPRCLKKVATDKKNAENHAREQYGKVPPDEFVRLVKQSQAQNEGDDYLGEYFYIGILEDGMFEVSYKARCKRCGFKHSFETEQKTSAFGVEQNGAVKDDRPDN